MRQKNSLGIPVIYEPVQTRIVDISGGDYKAPHIHGGKLKCKVTGTLKVHYLGDPHGEEWKRDLVVINPHVWIEDRIDIVYKDGSDITGAGDIYLAW